MVETLQLRCLSYIAEMVNIYGKITGHDLVSGKALVVGRLFHLVVVMTIRHLQILL